MARPKSTDPKVQRNIYPPTSLWEWIASIAKVEGRPAGEVAVEMLAEAKQARIEADSRPTYA